MNVGFPFRKVITRTKDHPSIMEAQVRYYLADFDKKGYHKSFYNKNDPNPCPFRIKLFLNDPSGKYAWIQILANKEVADK